VKSYLYFYHSNKNVLHTNGLWWTLLLCSFYLSSRLPKRFCYPFHHAYARKIINLIKGILYNIIQLNSILMGTHWNLTPIANAIWQFETSNIHKGFTPHSQGIWESLLVKQHKAHTPQGRKWIWNACSNFYYPTQFSDQKHFVVL
jgi:hypothetical protein